MFFELKFMYDRILYIYMCQLIKECYKQLFETLHLYEGSSVVLSFY